MLMGIAEMGVRVEDLDVGGKLTEEFVLPGREKLVRSVERVHRSARCLSDGPV